MATSKKPVKKPATKAVKPVKAPIGTTKDRKAPGKPVKAPIPVKAKPAKKATTPPKPVEATKPTEPQEKKNPGGRPTKFTPELAEQICELLAIGKPSREVCKEVGIADSALYRWLQKDGKFQEQYARARERQADFYVNEIIEIADELQIEATYKGEDVTLDVSSSAVARNRLRVDSRKWIASKLAPKKYGDKLQLGGADDLPPIKTDSTMVVSADEAYKRMLGTK